MAEPSIDKLDALRRRATDAAEASQPSAQQRDDADYRYDGSQSCPDRDENAACIERRGANGTLTNNRILNEGADENAPIDKELIKLAADRVALLAGQLIRARDTWPSSDYVTNGPQILQTALEIEFTGLQIISSNAPTQGNRLGNRSIQVLGPMSSEDVETISRSA